MITNEEFSTSYTKYFPQTIRVLSCFHFPFHVTSDLAQDAWIHGWEKREQWKGNSAFYTWVNAIAINNARRFLRTYGYRKVVPLLNADSSVAPVIYTGEFPINVTNLLSIVEEKYATILINRYLKEIPYNKNNYVAERLRVHRSLVRVRKALAASASAK